MFARTSSTLGSAAAVTSGRPFTMPKSASAVSKWHRSAVSAALAVVASLRHAAQQTLLRSKRRSGHL
eukprot:8922631-Alexandrium_andersonii.AAC.1